VIVVRIIEPRFVVRKDARPKDGPCALSREEDAAGGEAGRSGVRQDRWPAS